MTTERSVPPTTAPDPYRVLGVPHRAPQHAIRLAAREHRDAAGRLAAALLLDPHDRAIDGETRGVRPPAPTTPRARRLLLAGGVLCVLLTIVLLVATALVQPLGPESAAAARIAMFIGAAKAAAGAYLCLRYEHLKAEWSEWRTAPVRTSAALA